MHQNFHKELAGLRERFMTLGNMVEDRVSKACSVISSRNHKVIEEIIKSDYQIDEMEIEIEEECLKILALYQPVARDLRFIIAVIKINSELERIADYAVKIALRVQSIDKHDSLQFPMDFTLMTEKVRAMLKKSLDALLQWDAEKALAIFVLDDEVDNLRNMAFETIKASLRVQPEHAGCLLNGYLLARHLERIADRATNIAEEVIYIVEGEIVRGEHN